MATLTPSPRMQFLDANGNPLVGGKLYTYAAGTTTQLATYTDSTGGTPNTNPVILDSRGEASVWLGTALYYMELKNATDALQWSSDNIGGIATSNSLSQYASLAALAASGGSSLVGFVQSGTGAVSRTAQSKLREVISVADFGAVGDGVTDDLAAFNNAASAAASSGIPLLLEKKTYGLSGTWAIPSGVSVIGSGGGQFPTAAYATSANFIATPKTRLLALAGFPALTPVVSCRTANSALYASQNIDLDGFMIDCASVADYGLDIVTIKNSRFSNILVYRPKTRGVLEDCLVATHSGTAQAGAASAITLQTTASTRESLYNGLSIEITGGTGVGQVRTVSSYAGSTQVATVSVAWTTNPDATSTYTITGVATTEGNNACQFNKFENITVWTDLLSTATNWLQTGNPSNNINQCEYSGIKLQHGNGDGLVVENADTNTYHSIDTQTVGGTGVGIRLKGNNKQSLEYARNNTFVRTQLSAISGGTGGMTVETGTARGAQDNCVLSYSTGNSSPAPVIQTAATTASNTRFWFNIDGGSLVTDWRSFTPVITFTTPGDLSIVYTSQIGRFKKHGRTAEIEISLTFTPTFTTASGNFEITLPIALMAAAPSGAGIPYGMVITTSSIGWTWGTATFVTASVIQGTTTINIIGHQSNSSDVTLTTTNFPSGTPKTIRITGVMECIA